MINSVYVEIFIMFTVKNKKCVVHFLKKLDAFFFTFQYDKISEKKTTLNKTDSKFPIYQHGYTVFRLCLFKYLATAIFSKQICGKRVIRKMGSC